MLENTWTIIRIGIHGARSFASFHVRAFMSPCEAKAHAIHKLKSDWSNQRSDYLLNCIELGNFTVSHTTENKGA